METLLQSHLGYEKSSPEGYNTGNSRNGTSPKTVKTEANRRLKPTHKSPTAAGMRRCNRSVKSKEASKAK
jgi:hypothetical protein